MLVATFWLARRWWNVWAGLLAAVLLVLDANFWYVASVVGPETFTVACYLGAALLLSLRDDRWRSRMPELAGLLLGWGVTAHPCGVAAAPVVLGLPFLVARGFPGWAYLLRILIPAAAFAAAYAAFLLVNWAGVAANLDVHRIGRDVQPKGLLEKLAFEFSRYQSGALIFGTISRPDLGR